MWKYSSKVEIDVKYLFIWNHFLVNEPQSELSDGVVEFFTYLLKEYMPFGILNEGVSDKAMTILEEYKDDEKKFRELYELTPINHMPEDKNGKKLVLERFKKIVNALHRGKNNRCMHLLDYFSKVFLEVTFSSISPESNEYSILSNIIMGTQHTNALAKYSVESIFKIENLKSNEKFEKSMENQRFLLHGTYPSYVLGILREGLLIAPKFIKKSDKNYLGPGIYFADTAAAALGRFTKKNTFYKTAIILVCCVALGSNRRSTKYYGEDKLKDGDTAIVFKGQKYFNIPKLSFKSCDAERIRTFSIGDPPEYSYKQYNEYAVGNQNQVRIDYIIKLKREQGN